MLNLIIGLFFVYLILSMLSSGIQEAISGWIRLRGRMLEGAIRQMLNNESPERELEETIFDHFKDSKWLKSLERSKLTLFQSVMPIKKFPSYIKDSTFVTILLQALGSTAELKQVEATIQSMQDGKLKTFLAKALHDAEGDIEKFKAMITEWYNTTMKEVTIWYRHRSHTILFVIGFILAGVLNADTFAIYHKLSTNPDLAEQLANMAGDFVNERQSVTFDTLSNNNLDRELDSLSTELDQLIDQQLAQITTPLGLGWHKSDLAKTSSLNWWLMKILGVLITSFALAMGASFWFNLLKSLVSWRDGKKKADGTATEGT